MTIDARTGRRRPGPAPRVTREAVADAALDLGFDGLTVTAVGDRLGVSHAALYRHVRDRDDLVRAATERLAERHPPPPPAEHWRETLTGGAVAFWELLRSVPGFVEATLATEAARDVLAAHGTGLTRALTAHGFPPDLAVLAADSVLDLARDCARTAARLVSADPDVLRRRMAERWPDAADEPVRATVVDALLGDPADWFHRKLDVVVRGIATLVGR
ncbi:MAG: hypothetical protein ABS81_22555 [Pseudonocardia sp. SCN 72-86]|nr:MAG: hypothetical protein ABS81_22555 [Pseudonocardia sp. SCN 72-86]